MSFVGGRGADHILMPWYLAYTKPRQEQIAQSNLQQQGFEVYLPLYKTLPKNPGGAAAVLEPMFARYVFFRPVSPRQSLAGVRSTRGVCTLLSFGAEPATVTPEVIASIRSCERERNQLDLAALSPYQPGCQARLREGPLKGLVGTVKTASARRVTLLLELLGQQQHLQVQIQDLVPA